MDGWFTRELVQRAAEHLLGPRLLKRSLSATPAALDGVRGVWLGGSVRGSRDALSRVSLFVSEKELSAFRELPAVLGHNALLGWALGGALGLREGSRRLGSLLGWGRLEDWVLVRGAEKKPDWCPWDVDDLLVAARMHGADGVLLMKYQGRGTPVLIFVLGAGLSG